MLDTSTERLGRLSPDLRAIAENMASATMISELVENLIPEAEADAVAREHQVEGTEEWHRAVNAAVASLLALHKMGYALTRAAPASTDAPAV